MDKLCFSIDEERYDDRHGHVLSLVGWYMHTDKKKCKVKKRKSHKASQIFLVYGLVKKGCF